MISRFGYIAAVLLMLVLPTKAATSVIDWDYSTFTNKAALAADGDVLILKPGTNTWNFRTVNTVLFNLNKSLHVLGCGTNCTRLMITNFDGNHGISITGSSTSGNTWLWSDIMFDMYGSTGAGLSFGRNPGALPNYTNCVFRITRCGVLFRDGRAFQFGTGGCFGVVDHCTFTGVDGSPYQGNYVVTWGNSYPSWSVNPLGTTNMNFIEDCAFLPNNTGKAPSNGYFDGYRAGRAVYQHNLFVGPGANGTHGYDSDVSGHQCLLVLNNVFTNQDNSTMAAEVRSGTMIASSNVLYSTGASKMPTNLVFMLASYRSAWGSYRSTLGYIGFDKTNTYTGIALSATSNSLTCTNVPFGNQVAYYGTPGDSFIEFSGHNRTLTITGGTGAGQIAIITSNSMGSQTDPSTNKFSISGSFSPTPDATSTFEIGFGTNATETIGNVSYRFVVTPSQPRDVVLGANLLQTLQNYKACINKEDASTDNTRYWGATPVNDDLMVVSVSSSNMVLRGKMDGTGTLGYPGAQQPGTISMTEGTNTGVTLFPCLSVANTLNGTNVGFTRRFQNNGIYPNFNTNNVVQDRDYYDTNSIPFTLFYPSPLQSAIIATNAIFTIAASGASPTITTTEDLDAKSGIGSLTYHVGEPVTMTAPLSAGGSTFLIWQRDGVTYTTNLTITAYLVDSARTWTAVYTNTAVTLWAFTMQSSLPSSGITITNTADFLGSTSVVTPGFLFYADTTAVTMMAPSASQYGRFKQWNKNNAFFSVSNPLSVTASADSIYTAIYHEAQSIDGAVSYSGNLLLQ